MPVVLGGGISGLSAAYYLARKGQYKVPLSLYEASKHLGGWIKTDQHAKDGYFFETGPRTIRPSGVKGTNTLSLIEELGLSDRVIPILKTSAAAQNRMICVDNKLCLLPNNLGGAFKTLPPFSKPLIYAVLNDLKVGRSPKPLADESIYDFAERRFGTELAKYAISSMICGICAGDAKEISVKFLMEEIFRNEQKYGGVLRGFFGSMFLEKRVPEMLAQSALVERCKVEGWSIFSLNGGLEILPKTLVTKLECQNVKIKTSSECKRINFDGEKIHLAINDDSQSTDFLISSLPSYKLATLVEKEHPQLADELKSIPYVNVATVNLQYNRDDLLQLPGFGFLVPPSENLPILGVIYDSCCFDMKGNTVLTVMMGGKWFIEKFGHNPSHDELLTIAQDQLKNILKINVEPTSTSVNILRNCIPQYVLGHHDRVLRIRDYLRKRKLPLALCGAAYDGVGVNDVILSAKTAAASAVICNN